AVVALIGMIATGFMLFSADASKVADNAAFQLKMALIAAGLVKVTIYEFGAGRAGEDLGPGGVGALRARGGGGVGGIRGGWGRGMRSRHRVFVRTHILRRPAIPSPRP